MSSLPFWKMQTVGNDFVLLHSDDVSSRGLEGALPTLATRICMRHFGIGSDGLLVVGAEEGELHLRMFNPDGTEDFCGNGLRCAAAHAFEMGWVKAEHRIEHFGRLVSAVVLGDGTVKSAIGPAVYDPEEVPLDTSLHPGEMIDESVEGLVGSAVSTGSTHFVAFVESLPGDVVFEKTGSRIEHSPLFPERTSVIFAVETGVRKLTIRIWERGVGETFGCGTGSSAAAAEWMRKHNQAGAVEVTNPGGVLVVEADEIGGSLVTSSIPKTVFAGNLPVAVLQLA